MLEIFDDILEQWYLLDLDELSGNVVYPFSIVLHGILLVKSTSNSSNSSIQSTVWGNSFVLLMNLHFTLKVIIFILSCSNMYAALNRYKKYNVLNPMNTVVNSRFSISSSEYLLSIWSPKNAQLQFMICVNPLHLIVHLTDIHWYFKFVFIGLSAMLLSLIIFKYNQLIKDKQTLYELVMHEYNVKSVYPMQQLLAEEEYSLLDSPVQ